MYVSVEPLDGGELDRLVTVLLNVTGVVHQLIETSDWGQAAGGEEIIDIVAERLRDSLALIAEHHEDDELAQVTGVLAHATLLAADELGFADLYLDPDDE